MLQAVLANDFVNLHWLLIPCSTAGLFFGIFGGNVESPIKVLTLD
jgi:hypothetical protein